MRRGIKEMDLILGTFAAQHLDTLDEPALLLYDAMLSENDHDLYQWVSGQQTAPDRYRSLLDRIAVGIGEGIAFGRGA
jgi:antitoxin CptB